MKTPDIEALNCALKVKQYINAIKTNNQINKLQKVFTKKSVVDNSVGRALSFSHEGPRFKSR
jgi:hypothetical protein